MELTEDWITADDDELMRELRGQGYDRNKYYIKSTDGHGHSAKLQTKIHEAEVAQMVKWVSHPGTTYRSTGDFVRDAIAHRLHDMHEFHLNGKLDREAKTSLKLSYLGTLRIEREQREELLKVLTTEIAVMIEQSQISEAATIIDELREDVQEWPETQRKRAVQVLDNLHIQVTSAVRMRSKGATS